MFMSLKGMVLLSTLGITFISIQNTEVGESSKGVISGNNTTEIADASRNRTVTTTRTTRTTTTTTTTGISSLEMQ